MKNSYQPPDYNTDIDTGVFDFQNYGHCVFRPNTMLNIPERDDIISFDSDNDSSELIKNLKFGSSPTAEEYKTTITNLIKSHWDSFCSKGACRPIIGYEFAIDTGTSAPVCK